MGVAYVRFAVANPSHYRVMFGKFVAPSGRVPELETEAAGALHALVDALIALQREGLVRADEPMTQARFVWALVHGVAMLAIDGQLHEPDATEILTRYALDRLAVGIATGSDRAPA
jgi:hypothetical protein